MRKNKQNNSVYFLNNKFSEMEVERERERIEKPMVTHTHVVYVMYVVHVMYVMYVM